MGQKLTAVEDRRSFIKSASAFAITLSALPVGLSCSQSRSAANALMSERPSQIDVVAPEEQGTRILLRGTIYDVNSKAVPNVRIFLYHTDATGYYSRPVNNPRQARLHGTLWSNAQGKYSFSTIKPAHYADVNPAPPMHIHVHLEPPNLPDHWVDSYYFEGDPRLSPDDINRSRGLATFSNIVSLARGEAGVLTGVRDFRIDPALAVRNQLSDGWYRQ